MEKIRWGLLGAGALLNRWLKGFEQMDDAEIAGIASRTIETAKKQAARFDIADAMTYDELLKRTDIDVMYIDVPHTAHKELAMRAMDAGFPVLVEKPAAVTAADWREMTECARKNNVFLMEAVWTRFFPAIQKALTVIKSGEIGDIRCLQASFAYRIADDYQGRLTDPMLAGGSLMDVGVYNLHLAHMIFGRSPLHWVSVASIGNDEMKLNVDEQACYVGEYENGALAILTSAIRTEIPNTARIFGTKGFIEIPMYWKAEKFTLNSEGKTEVFASPVPQRIEGITDEGYQFEIRHVQDCLWKDLKESPLLPHAVTEAVLSGCDEIRKQWGLKYPFE